MKGMIVLGVKVTVFNPFIVIEYGMFFCVSCANEEPWYRVYNVHSTVLVHESSKRKISMCVESLIAIEDALKQIIIRNVIRKKISTERDNSFSMNLIKNGFHVLVKICRFHDSRPQQRI